VVSSPVVETTKTENSSTLDEAAVSQTPVLGRKFEDLLTLTPGVSISQGPDADEININGSAASSTTSASMAVITTTALRRANGGQRAAIDSSTLEAVKEFQVVASGANPDSVRTAGGVVNVITKSGTKRISCSAFEYSAPKPSPAATSERQAPRLIFRESSWRQFRLAPHQVSSSSSARTKGPLREDFP